MKLTQIAGVMLAVVLVTTSVAAALPGNAPADQRAEQMTNDTQAESTEDTDAQADDNGTDAADGAETDEDGAEYDGANATDGDGMADQRRGPPTDLPGPVPDFVSEIHDLIRGKLDGTVSNLGERIGDVTPGGEDDRSGDRAGGPPASAPVA